MASKKIKNPEKSFGFSVGLVLCVLSAALIWRGRIRTAEIAGPIGVLLVAFAAVWPSALKWPSAIWWRFSRALGAMNARILLTVAYAIVLIPVGLIWRITGKDPLARR